MQVEPVARVRMSLRDLFIENVDGRRVVTMARGEEDVRTCNPLVSLLRMQQSYRASRYASAMLNAARAFNDKEPVAIRPVLTVRQWNQIIASIWIEQTETHRLFLAS